MKQGAHGTDDAQSDFPHLDGGAASPIAGESRSSSLSTAKLLWQRETPGEATKYEQENAHSPLPAVRDWLIGSEALDHAGLGFVLVEFIPHYDEPEGKRVLRQEVLLLGRHDEVDRQFLLERLARYNGVAGALQGNNLGLYQHDFITGAGSGANACSGEILISDMVGSSGAKGRDERERTWLELKRAALLRHLAEPAPGPADQSEVGANSVQRGECLHDEGHLYYWSAQPLAEVGILPDRASVEAIRARAKNEHHSWRYEDQKQDCSLTLDVAHEILRQEFAVPDERGTWLAVARLETNNRGADEEEPDAVGIPRSYRGAVWIYAEGGELDCPYRKRALLEMLRTSLLAGNISVEAQASEALANGLRRFATRTASVAIMSRNMSHNLGSHVLSGIVSQKEAAAFAGEPVVFERHDLFRYLQERMDFLAEVSTSGAFMATPLSLATILSSFKEQQLLLGYISGLADSDGDPIKADLVTRGGLDGGDLLVLSPGGRNGCHALYVILENIIRNSAKHSYPAEVPDEIEVSITAEEEGDLVKVVIWDRARSADSRRGDVSNVQHLASVISEGSMITDAGSLKPGSWGIREMMIAAAYLRGLPLEQIGSGLPISPGAPPLLRAVRVDDSGVETTSSAPANLGFVIYLQRPQILCAIDPILSETVAADRRKELFGQGISIFASTGEVNRTARDSSYVAIQDGAGLEVDGDWPHRRLKMTGKLRTLLGSNESPGDLAQKVWLEAARSWQEELQARHAMEDLEAVARREHGNLPGWRSNPAARHKLAYIRHLPKASEIPALEDYVFWEFYGGNSDQRFLLETPPAPAAQSLQHEFIAAAISHIVVLDERVQAAVEGHPGYLQGTGAESSPYVLTKSESLRKRRISVPGSSICPLKGDIRWGILERYLTNHLLKPADIVVIHLGILERMFPRTGWRVSLDKVLAWASSQEDKGKPDIVICSGRGSNEAQLVNQRFVAASAVERWTVHAPSKFDLYQLLVSSRRPTAHPETQA